MWIYCLQFVQFPPLHTHAHDNDDNLSSFDFQFIIKLQTLQTGQKGHSRRVGCSSESIVKILKLFTTNWRRMEWKFDIFDESDANNERSLLLMALCATIEASPSSFLSISLFAIWLSFTSFAMRLLFGLKSHQNDWLLLLLADEFSRPSSRCS